MKKVAVLLFMLMFSCGTAFAEAAKVGYDAVREQRRAEMKTIKAEQRAKREQAKTAATPAVKKEKGFWEKEAERSGLAESKGGAASIFRNLNPAPFFKNQAEQYKARKTAATDSKTAGQ